MDKISHEYVGAIVLLVVGLAQAFGVVLEQAMVTGIVTGVVALYVAYRRHGKGDITALGGKK